MEQITTCSWVALCENEATNLVQHAILGGIPTCDRCVEQYDLTDRVTNDSNRLVEVRGY